MSDDYISVDGFLDIVFKASGLEVSPEAPSWAKWVDRVNPALNGGYMFEGEFISATGTTRLAVGRARLILACAGRKDVMSRYGVRRLFRVVILDAQGNLKPSHISADDERAGWANRIVELVENLLADIAKVHEPDGTVNRFALLDAAEDNEDKRGLISCCDGCGSRKLTANLTEYQGSHMCPVCAELIAAVDAWSMSTRQSQKALEIIKIISSKKARKH